MSNAIKSLRKGLNNILKVREDIGADLRRVKLVTRTWTGVSVGDGKYSDEITDVRPTPRIADYSHSLRLVEGGHIKQGDLILKNISKKTFENKKEIDGTGLGKNIERFYMVGDYLYNVINVTEKHLTWHVQVRKHSYQEVG